MGLFQLGDFTLNSGARSAWKLECDALTDGDITALAKMIHQMVEPFGSVEGIPRGGLRLAAELSKYAIDNMGLPLPTSHLIVDDVLTTGSSMEQARAAFEDRYRVPYKRIILPPPVGVVIFARGRCPKWIKAVFQCPEELWPSSRSG